MEHNDAFLGRGWSFPPRFYASGREVEMVAGEEDIRQSLQILFRTSIAERTMFSAYGSELSRALFEEVDQSLLNSLNGVISDAILNNEPRIKLDGVEVDQDAEDAGLLIISVDYTVRTTNNRYNMVYPFYINEATNQ